MWGYKNHLAGSWGEFSLLGRGEGEGLRMQLQRFTDSRVESLLVTAKPGKPLSAELGTAKVNTQSLQKWISAEDET